MKQRWKEEREEGGQGENGTIILSNDIADAVFPAVCKII